MPSEASVQAEGLIWPWDGDHNHAEASMRANVRCGYRRHQRCRKNPAGTVLDSRYGPTGARSRTRQTTKIQARFHKSAPCGAGSIRCRNTGSGNAQENWFGSIEIMTQNRKVSKPRPMIILTQCSATDSLRRSYDARNERLAPVRDRPAPMISQCLPWRWRRRLGAWLAG